MPAGKVYLVGAGPGDPGLLTCRGRDLLVRADVVVYDHLASPRLLAYAPAAAQRLYVGKQPGRHSMHQEQINALLIELARAGRTVVRLKGGDPFVFGRGGEEALALVEAGVEFEVVPGVTAAMAAAAYAGIPVTHRGLADSLAIITGHDKSGDWERSIDWSLLGRWRGTLAFYMGMANLQPICRRMVEAGMDGNTPAAVISQGTLPAQRVIAASLSDLPERAGQAGIAPPAMIVIGPVAALRDKLAWFERKPMFGLRIAVTRARAQASGLAAMLSELGADVVETPAIAVAPAPDQQALRRAAEQACEYDWIVFTSANAVDSFFAALASVGRDCRALARCKIASIGPATTQRLAATGIGADIQPREFLGKRLAEAMAEAGELAGKSILCPRSDIAPPGLTEALAAGGAEVVQVAAYSTVIDPAGPKELALRLQSGGLDWITFTSSSSVTNLLSAVGADLIRSAAVRLGTIGPSTSATLRAAGLEPSVEAAEHTAAGLVQALVSAVTAIAGSET